ncbi:PF07603 family protein [Leptospira weilii serovar Ranarum str. ICFT]|uniref:PF07603 family protein n=1 Tax=Leptospira weilii serovar Ranarum str. ICFT TaxID=1218598 RepID=N1WMB7_9LEPT|nr:DUF1566 domain-containing protein [Leptospira weilii]EMY76928.1 PF07603 family protein [Leptospira weilii serovar Ranarum str. ICFT]
MIKKQFIIGLLIVIYSCSFLKEEKGWKESFHLNKSIFEIGSKLDVSASLFYGELDISKLKSFQLNKESNGVMADFLNSEGLYNFSKTQEFNPIKNISEYQKRSNLLYPLLILIPKKMKVHFQSRSIYNKSGSSLNNDLTCKVTNKFYLKDLERGLFKKDVKYLERTMQQNGLLDSSTILDFDKIDEAMVYSNTSCDSVQGIKDKQNCWYNNSWRIMYQENFPIIVANCQEKESIIYSKLKDREHFYEETTNLSWQKCPSGLNGLQCERGKLNQLTIDQAISLCKNINPKNQWRLPTLEELWKFNLFTDSNSGAEVKKIYKDNSISLLHSQDLFLGENNTSSHFAKGIFESKYEIVNNESILPFICVSEYID